MRTIIHQHAHIMRTIIHHQHRVTLASLSPGVLVWPYCAMVSAALRISHGTIGANFCIY